MNVLCELLFPPCTEVGLCVRPCENCMPRGLRTYSETADERGSGVVPRLRLLSDNFLGNQAVVTPMHCVGSSTHQVTIQRHAPAITKLALATRSLCDMTNKPRVCHTKTYVHGASMYMCMYTCTHAERAAESRLIAHLVK